jgi:hypothetical protein
MVSLRQLCVNNWVTPVLPLVDLKLSDRGAHIADFGLVNLQANHVPRLVNQAHLQLVDQGTHAVHGVAEGVNAHARTCRQGLRQPIRQLQDQGKHTAYLNEIRNPGQ